MKWKKHWFCFGRWLVWSGPRKASEEVLLQPPAPLRKNWRTATTLDVDRRLFDHCCSHFLHKSRPTGTCTWKIICHIMQITIEWWSPKLPTCSPLESKEKRKKKKELPISLFRTDKSIGSLMVKLFEQYMPYWSALVVCSSTVWKRSKPCLRWKP